MSKIIVIDGIDGVGKSTQFNLLKDKLETSNYKVHTIHFPVYEEDGSFFVRKFLNGDIDNPSPYAVAMMYSLDIYLYFKNHPEVSELLYGIDSDNNIMLCDRYTSSSMLYQVAMLQEYGISMYYDEKKLSEFINNINHKVLKIPYPDLVLLLTADTETTERLAKERATATDGSLDVLESNHNLQCRVQNNMIWVDQYYTTTRINCNHKTESTKLAPVEDIHEFILEALRDKLFIEI